MTVFKSGLLIVLQAVTDNTLENKEVDKFAIMGKQAKKPQPKQNTRSSRVKAPLTTVTRKKTSSPFSRTSKVVASCKAKVNNSPLKVSQKSKSIKKVAKLAAKKLDSNKTKKLVALKTKIDQMNKKIKLAEKNQPSKKVAEKNQPSKKVAEKNQPSKKVAKKPANKASKKPIDKVVEKPKTSGIKSGNIAKADSRDNVVKNTVQPPKNRPAKIVNTTKQPPKEVEKLSIKKCNPKLKKAKVAVSKSKPVKKVVTRKATKEVKKVIKRTVKAVIAKKPSEQKPKSTLRKRKLEPSESEDDASGQKVSYIHVGEGGERDLEEHLHGSSRVNIQILSTERLPDIDDSDMIHGLDHAGTSRDYVDDRHRCTVRCPVGCQGHLRPNEIVIYESVRYDGRLLGRKRIKGRFVEGDPGDQVVAALEMTDFRRIGGRGNRRRLNERNQRRRLVTQQRYRRTMEEDRNDSPIPPLPARLGVASGLPQRVAILLDSPPVERVVAEEHAWNTNDRSFNVILKEDDSLTMRRHPVAQSTDCIRGKIGYSSGIHLWEVTWPVRQRGTHAVVGVATREAVLHSVGYQSLVGNTEHSWGWDLGRKKAYHDSRANEGTNYPPTITHHHQWTVPDTFNMVLDMDSGSLGYIVGDQFLGWAHTSVKSGERVFPVVSTVWGHCEVKLKYLGGLEKGVIGLQELTRGVIRDVIGRGEELSRSVETLSLPTQMKNYLKYD
eukprot:GFUD01009316.1.p1 GENE.GFUD01009316.1~~GFUD01009316.1.p1  ORF type:complete len:719 (-),score=167.90 GFUD01009316.1:112-2268(-)